MAKKRQQQGPAEAEPERTDGQSLGAFLANIRSIKKLTLREVEEATGKEVSNAYLSQLETGKITRPSPNVLHALAVVYGVPYETLMQKAGYISPASPGGAGILRSASPARLDRIAAFGDESLTLEEQEKLLEYLAFLRSRKGTRGKG